VTLNLAETSVAKSRSSISYGANLLLVDRGNNMAYPVERVRRCETFASCDQMPEVQRWFLMWGPQLATPAVAELLINLRFSWSLLMMPLVWQECDVKWRRRGFC